MVGGGVGDFGGLGTSAVRGVVVDGSHKVFWREGGMVDSDYSEVVPGKAASENSPSWNQISAFDIDLV
jgi:hypothetical protein